VRRPLLILAAVAGVVAIMVGLGTAGIFVVRAEPRWVPAPAAAPAPADPATPPVPDAAPSPGPTSSPPGPPPAASPAAPTRSAAPPAPEAQVLALVNVERARAGCAPVTPDARLATAAHAHSADMAGRNYFAHTDPDGYDPGRRITAAGYRWSTYGENIASGFRDPDSVMTGWMNSPGHRRNILDCRFRNLGVGLAYDGRHYPYWTQDFGSPA
jgi:uncharacterized protein YkwD